MKLLKYPRSSPLLIAASILLGLIIALGIAHLVFEFAYYASGLAAAKQEEDRRARSPIDVKFTDPNAPAQAPAGRRR
ncbi:MAG: hypothetical protein ACE5HU_00810 [Acidobacteriota bacterium]